jgi:L-idonate 5-dehydrogenase
MTDDIPETALGVVAHAKDDLRVEEISVPRPEAHQAVISVAFGGICGSDLHYWTHGAAGESILKAPMVLGHEVVGTVVVAASDGSGPLVGATVAVHPATPGPGDGSRYPEDSPNLSPGCTYLGSAAVPPYRRRFCPHCGARQPDAA